MRSCLPALFAFVACAVLHRPAAGITVPANFAVDDVAPGADFDIPVAIAFLPDGRLLVAEKRGRVYEVRNGVRQPNPLVAIDDEVLSGNDRGLLGIAVDPQYAINHYLYLLYTVDPDSNGIETDNDAFSRLTRYQVDFDDSSSVIPSSRTILMGDTWTNGAVSASAGHTIGALRWGEDGSLLAASGDAAQFNTVDAGGLDPGAFGPGRTDPAEDIGAFRAQYVGSLSGKILRLDPATGHGYATNPFATADLTEPRSKVWCYGMRNPYRFGVRPGTGHPDPAAGDPGTLYIGDVGWFSYEETHVAAAGGENFGWPCFEGIGPQPGYQSANPAHHGCGSIGTPDNPSPHTPPLSQWHHGNGSLSIPPGITGITSTGGVFYTAGQYPPAWRNQYFYADYGHHWIKVAVVDSSDQLTQVLDFADEADGPIDMATHPVTGDVHYLSITTGQIRRIRYTGPIGDNNPPLASLSANPTAGPAPLGVEFSSAGSFDADGDSLTYSWLFGDGGSSQETSPFHLYTTPGVYQAQLTVSEAQGGLDVESVTITVLSGSAGFPATAVLDDFNRPDGPIGDPWVDDTAGLLVAGQTLTQSSPASSTVWNGGSFGAGQEAYITFSTAPPPAAVVSLMLMAQGTSGSAGHVEVAWHAAEAQVSVSTYAPSEGWIVRGTLGAVFGAGDQLGARIHSPGIVAVYQNGSLLGGSSFFNWPFATAGGRLGLTLAGLDGAGVDDFGGGTVVPVVNTPPTAQIVTPLPNAPFHEAEEIALSGTGSDSQTPAEELAYEWVVDLHHNIHTHPAIFTFEGPEATLIGENHDDGTGVFFRVHLIVTDPEGLRDTTHVDIYPEVDLEPAAVTTIPAPPIEGQPVEIRVHLRNHGRMPAPLSRWVLLFDGVELAAQETIVPAEDSVLISAAAIAPAAGLHELRVRADSLDAVVETDETNNALMAGLDVWTSTNTPPVAGIAFPTGPTYGAPDTLVLVSSSSDFEDPIVALTLDWGVTLHRTSGDSLLRTVSGDSAEVVLRDYEVNEGVTVEVSLRVTDSGGLTDSASVVMRPDCNLSPSPVVTNAGHLAAGLPVEASFRLRNFGAHSARLTHWSLMLDGQPFAEGDREVRALDSVTVHVTLPGGLSEGPHHFRSCADTLDALIETDETDNAAEIVVEVPATTLGITGGPGPALALSAPRPNPSRDAIEMTLELPQVCEVTFEVLDLQGRVVSAPSRRPLGPGRWTLRWDGRRADGTPTGPGRYFARVRAGETELVRELTRLR